MKYLDKLASLGKIVAMPLVVTAALLNPFSTVKAESNIPQKAALEQRYYGVPDNNGDGIADEKDYFDIPKEVMDEMFPDPETYSLNKAALTAPQWYIDKMNNIFRQPDTNGDLLWYGSGDADSSGLVDWDDHYAMQQGVQNDMADVDGDGFPSTANDQQILEDKLNGVTHYMPAYKNSFQDFSEMHSWNQNIWEIDQLDTTTWVYNEYVSGDFGRETYIRNFGYFDTSDVNIPQEYDLSVNARFNQPVYYVSIFNPNGAGHGMNMMFKNPEIITNDSLSIENCYLIEPQEDGLDIGTNNWSVPNGTRIKIYGIEGFYDNGAQISYPIAAFQDNDNNGTFELYGQNPNLVLSKPVSVKTSPNIPTNIHLTQNFPNPFNSTTSFNYSLTLQNKVSLILYNMRGEVLRVLVDEIKPAGSHTITLNISDFDSGVYFYTLQTESGYSTTKKMTLIK